MGVYRVVGSTERRGRKIAEDSDSVAEAAGSLNGDTTFLAAVDRTMRTIEMLADAADGMTISAIARALDVNKQIAVRILNTLLQRGYIFQTPEQMYKLTYKVSNIGFRQQSTARLTDQCLPLIRALAEETGELVRLAVIEGGKPIWLHAATGRTQRLRLDPVWPAEVLPHAHAVGKVMLSILADEEIARLLGPEPFPQQTPRTLTTLSELMADVRAVAGRGFALSCEEAEPGVGAIAAPVIAGIPPRPMAIVSIAAPTSRISCEALVGMGPRLIEVAHQLADVWPLL